MNRTFLTYAVAALACATAAAQAPIVVGSGSYAASVPTYKSRTAQHEGCRSMAVETQKLWMDHDGERPIPTNDWWTDLINNRFAEALWSLPAWVGTSEQGATVNYAKEWSDNGTELTSKSSVTIGASGFSAASAIASDWGDWHIVARFPSADDASRQIRVTLLHGSPFTWAEYEGELTPSITFSTTPEFFGAKPGRTGLRLGNDLYGLYYADNAETAMRADALEIQGTNFVVVALLRSESDLEGFADYAPIIPTATKLSWEFNEQQSLLTTHWHIDSRNLRNGTTGADIIQGFLPHALKTAIKAPAQYGDFYVTPRGRMRLSTGNDFEFTYRFTGILPYFAIPGQESMKGDNPYRPKRMEEMLRNYADKGTFGDDTYWGGKGLVQMALCMMTARDNGWTDIYDKSRQALRATLEDWLTYEPGEQKRFFAYYPRWRSLVGYDVSYDSDAFNDHHFHYGYFIYAGALLCMADPDFASRYGEMLKLIAKDYANYDHNDDRFPFLRTMDPWVGHSYAGGLGDHLNRNGNGQESSSECMQSWGAVYLLGVALGDRQLRDAGIFGWYTESQATAEYWFDRDHIYDDGREHNYDYTKYTSPYCTNLTAKGIGWWTWFSGDSVWMHSIQWMPVSPLLNYLSRDLQFAKWDYDTMISTTSRRWFERTGTPDQDGNLPEGPLADESLGNVVLCYMERSRPDEAAAIFDRAWDLNMGMAHGIDTGHISYYTIHSHRTYGEIDWDVYADTPTATAYRRKDGTITYVVYNAPGTDTERTVNFYRNGTLERSVRMRAGEGMVAFSEPATATSIRISSPEGDILAPGSTSMLTADVLDQYGASCNETVTLNIASGNASLSGNRLSIPADAPLGSHITVTATGAGISADLIIKVNHKPVPTTVTLSPTPAYVLTGTGVDFKATVLDQYGKEMACDVIFSDNAPRGKFTADMAGKATITVQAGEVSASHTMIVVPSLPDLALHRPVEASSFENVGCVPQHATDGNDASRWGSEHTDDEWIYVDLERECSIVNIDINWEAAFAKAYDIDFSDDALNWTTVAHVTGVTGPGTVSTTVDGKARYVRIHGRERGSAYGYSLFTLRVQGIDPAVSTDDIAGITISAPVMMEEGSSTEVTAQGVTLSGYLKELESPVWTLQDAEGNELPGCLDGNVLTPSTYGSLTLKVTDGSVTAAKPILVTESVKAYSITATPSKATVIVGDPVFFDVEAYNQFGGLWPLDSDNLTVSVHRNEEVSDDTYNYDTSSLTPTQTGAYTLDFTPEGYELTAAASFKAVALTEANLALGCRAWASSSRGDSPTAVTDGNPDGKRWESEWGTDGEWIAIDLGRAYYLTNVRLFWEAAFAKSYIIETSMDGETWETAADISESQGGIENVTLTAPMQVLADGNDGDKVASRFIRLISRRRALEAYGNSLYEFEVYGSGVHGTNTGIEEISPSYDGMAGLYDLTGNKVIRPRAAGVYIRRNADGTVSKIIGARPR